MIGQTISHYRIEEKVGQGGMGVVYRARDTRLDRTVALKMLLPEFAADPGLRRRLATEARAASALNHPAIATVHDFEEVSDSTFIVYEYVKGTNLREMMRRRSLDLPAVLAICIQIAEGLAAAQEAGIVHRDLKPENVMITEASRVKILDFGLAKLRPRAAETTRASPLAREGPTVSTAPGLLLGTVNYMSPEQLEGEEVDPRTDVFSFGVMLYEMAARRHPFVGKSPISTIGNILKEEPASLALWNPQAPAELERIIRKCVRKRPEERYQSTRDLLVDLESIRRALSSSSPEAAAPSEAELALPRGVARALLVIIQLGYLAMYCAALYHVDSLASKVPFQDGLGRAALAGVIVWALCGIAVRLYLLAAVGFDHPATGVQFRRLFPAVLALDGAWAASPLLLAPKIGLGLALACAAALAYLPFSQRTLIQSAYRVPTPSGSNTPRG